MGYVCLEREGEKARETNRQTDDEGLAHVIIEADKFPDLQGESASCRPGERMLQLWPESEGLRPG